MLRWPDTRAVLPLPLGNSIASFDIYWTDSSYEFCDAVLLLTAGQADCSHPLVTIAATAALTAGEHDLVGGLGNPLVLAVGRGQYS